MRDPNFWGDEGPWLDIERARRILLWLFWVTLLVGIVVIAVSV